MARQQLHMRHVQALVELEARGMKINRLSVSELARMEARTKLAVERQSRVIGETTFAALQAAIVQARSQSAALPEAARPGR